MKAATKFDVIWNAIGICQERLDIIEDRLEERKNEERGLKTISKEED